IPMDAPLKTQDDWSEFQAARATDRVYLDHYSQYGSAQTRDNTWQPHHSLHRPPAPGQLTLSALIAAGAHLGHSTSLLNQNFMPYAYGTRAGITLIDLDHTVPMLRRAANLTRSVAAAGGTVVFIGTRPDIRGAVKKASERMGVQSYYVGDKWLPGTLTNRQHHFGQHTVETTKIIPDLLVILNPLANMPAIREAAIEHIPTIGIIDSNVDPRIVMYAIPANDESTRTAELVAGVLSIAGREGIEIRKEEQRRIEAAREQASREYNS
ncbi:ribosomal protein S2, flavodoxin-like domain-containing protein, partial [Phellopilus nigrolimitatus]